MLTYFLCFQRKGRLKYVEDCMETACDKPRGLKEDEKRKKSMNTVKRKKLGYFD